MVEVLCQRIMSTTGVMYIKASDTSGARASKHHLKRTCAERPPMGAAVKKQRRRDGGVLIADVGREPMSFGFARSLPRGGTLGLSVSVLRDDYNDPPCRGNGVQQLRH